MDVLQDLFRHEAWADMEMFRAIQACPPAWQDSRIRERLHHAHMAQRAYLGLFQGVSPDMDELQRPFDSLDALQLSARKYHRETKALVDGLSPDQLAAPVAFPLNGFRPSLAEAMLQVVLHSQYHRGQTAARLRELGGEPPLTDFIVWAAKGRPDLDAREGGRETGDEEAARNKPAESAQKGAKRRGGV